MKLQLLVLAALVATAVAFIVPDDYDEYYSPEIVMVPGGKSGYGKTTRYWDCCKPSCAWKENIKTPDMKPIRTCNKDGKTVASPSVQSGCNGGKAYMCNNQQPFAINKTMAYGFAAISLSGGVDTNLCCACFLLSFTDQITDKKMIVQFTNSGGDLGQNHFDLAMPGGGVGIFTQGCHDQWNAPWSGWGDQYGGVSSKEKCYSDLPKELQPGCAFRFDFFKNANNPQMKFDQVVCPREIVERSGCNLSP